VEDNESNIERSSSKKKLVLLAVIVVAALALAGWLVTRDSSRTTTNKTEVQDKTAQERIVNDAPLLTSKFEAQYDLRSRTVLFKPGTTTLENEDLTTAVGRSIAEFYKANKDVKFVVNGSVLDTDETGAANTLAKQRAELVKQRLVSQGIDAAVISVTTTDTYKGKDNKARAEYERSVVISAL
jgi:outer membrane protein OmpA-like peptidoglycan-associated protein